MPSVDLTEKRILWFEDEVFTVELIAKILSSAGAEVVFAKTLSDGLKAVKNNVFDLIILDCMVPLGNGPCLQMDPRKAGVEVVQTLKDKSVSRSGETPVLVLSAVLDDSISLRLRELGVVAILSKPIGAQQLIKLIGKIIG